MSGSKSPSNPQLKLFAHTQVNTQVHTSEVFQMEWAWGEPEVESQADATNPSLTPGGVGGVCVCRDTTTKAQLQNTHQPVLKI